MLGDGADDVGPDESTKIADRVNQRNARSRGHSCQELAGERPEGAEGAGIHHLELVPAMVKFRAYGQALSLASNDSFIHTHSDAKRLWYKEKRQ